MLVSLQVPFLVFGRRIRHFGNDRFSAAAAALVLSMLVSLRSSHSSPLTAESAAG
jgi:hypothetical protein